MTGKEETWLGAVVGDFLLEQSRIDDDIFFIIADGKLPGTEEFIAEFPQRVLNVGVAEQNGMAVAGGLAQSGKTVYMWNCSTFLVYRPYDQIRFDAAYPKNRVRLIGTSAGYTRSISGMAHIAIEDVAVMRALPNMTVVCPGDLVETRALLRHCHDVDGPVYFRFPTEREELPMIHSPDTRIELGRAATVCAGDHAALVVTGYMLPDARRWVDEWAVKGFRVELVSVPTIKPFDTAAIAALVQRGLPIITLEEHNVIGGLGSAVAEAIAGTGTGVPFLRVGIPDQYTYVVGGAACLKSHLGVPDAADLVPWLRAHVIDATVAEVARS